MRVRLKGINPVTCRLADGTRKTYWYAWKGGPRLRGEPGSPEFIASYNEAVARKVTPPTGVLLNILTKFESTEEFRLLSERSKADYKQIIDRRIAPEFADFPLAALTDKRARGVFKDWRDRLALKSRRQADYAWVVLARVLSVALDRGWIDANPCEKGGRLYHGTRADKIWTPDQVEAFLRSAPPHLLTALMLGLWTGQREGDLLDLTWFAYDGSHIRLIQSKSIRLGDRKRARRVCIPVGAPLKEMLDAMPRQHERLLVNSYGEPWTEDGFRASWATAQARAGVPARKHDGVSFNDLRGTAVTRLALAGCSEAQIATITGHTLGQVRSILDAHYLHRHPELGEQAIRKLEAGTNSPKCTPKWFELFQRTAKKDQ
jgi:integrase